MSQRVRALDPPPQARRIEGSGDENAGEVFHATDNILGQISEHIFAPDRDYSSYSHAHEYDTIGCYTISPGKEISHTAEILVQPPVQLMDFWEKMMLSIFAMLGIIAKKINDYVLPAPIFHKQSDS